MQTTIGHIHAQRWDPWMGIGGLHGLHMECRGARGTGSVLYIPITDYSDNPRQRPNRDPEYPFYMIPVIIEEETRGKFNSIQYDSEGCPDPILQTSNHYTGRTETGVPIRLSEEDRHRGFGTVVRMYATDRDSAPDRRTFMKELGALTYDEHRELEKAREAA